MVHAKYVYTYPDDLFLSAIPEGKMITTVGVAKHVGCSYMLATRRMPRLEEQNKIKRVEIIGGRDTVWQKVV